MRMFHVGLFGVLLLSFYKAFIWFYKSVKVFVGVCIGFH